MNDDSSDFITETCLSIRAKEVEKRKEKLSTKEADKAVPYLLIADFTDASGLMTFPKVS